MEIGSKFRFSGLVSGMDTDNMVKEIMKAERMPLDKLYQSKQLQEWKRDSYREANTKMLDFRTSMQNLRLQSTFVQKQITSSDDTKVGAERVGTPNFDNYKLTNFTKPVVASSSSVKIVANSAITNDSTRFSSAITGAGSFTFQLNGEEINVNPSDNMRDVVARINAKKDDTGVVATYFKDNNSITFTSLTKGEGSYVSITNVSDPANFLNFSDGTVAVSAPPAPDVNDFETDTNPYTTGHVGKLATNGSVKINGTDYEIAGNTFTYDGIRFSLKDVSPTDEVDVELKPDTETVFNSVKDFVTKYNDVIGEFNRLVKEKKFRNFPPLLKEQREQMQDTEIELWEEKAKSGLLARDSNLMDLLNRLRRSVSDKVGGATNTQMDTLSEIGITASNDYRENGKLVIDETKLRSAIADNIDDVKSLFTKLDSSGSGNTTTNPTRYSKSGVGWRIYDQLKSTMDAITEKVGQNDGDSSSVFGRNIKQFDERINDMEKKMSTIENRYWKQFTAMEKALSKMNSQGSQLQAALG